MQRFHRRLPAPCRRHHLSGGEASHSFASLPGFRLMLQADALGLAARVLTVHWPGGVLPQRGDKMAAARDARYELLLSAAAAARRRHLLLAHHADDQAETFVLRLLHASGLAGLACMPTVADKQTGGQGAGARASSAGVCSRQPPDLSGPVLTSSQLCGNTETPLLCDSQLPADPCAPPCAAERGPVSLLRPLLSFRKAELEGYCRHQGLHAVQDPTNADLSFQRNRIRHLLHTVRQPAAAATADIWPRGGWAAAGAAGAAASGTHGSGPSIVDDVLLLQRRCEQHARQQHGAEEALLCTAVLWTSCSGLPSAQQQQPQEDEEEQQQQLDGGQPGAWPHLSQVRSAARTVRVLVGPGAPPTLRHARMHRPITTCRWQPRCSRCATRCSMSAAWQQRLRRQRLALSHGCCRRWQVRAVGAGSSLIERVHAGHAPAAHPAARLAPELHFLFPSAFCRSVLPSATGATPAPAEAAAGWPAARRVHWGRLPRPAGATQPRRAGSVRGAGRCGARTGGAGRSPPAAATTIRSS